MQESDLRQWTVLLPSGPVGGEVGARCHQSHCWDSRVRECDQLYTITKRHYYSARICLCETGKPQQQALAGGPRRERRSLSKLCGSLRRERGS